MPSLGNIGEKLDLKIRQGATLGPFKATMLLASGEPFDLTGATIRGQIRRRALSEEVTADIQVEIPAPLLGEYQFGLDDETTAGMEAGEALADSESLYVWDLELELSDGTVKPLYYGKVSVFREVTRG